MSAQPEVWRVSTVEGIFETDLETLQQWIVEGCVLPTDKVSKGNLSWIDAGRVPKLKAAFNGETTPTQNVSVDTFVESNLEVTKIDAEILRDARIVVSIRGGQLSEYFNSLLRPLVTRDKASALAQEQAGKEKAAKPKR